MRPRSPWASDEHELFRETARAWVEREILPNDERLAGAWLRRRRALAERGGGRAAGHRRAGGARRARGRLRLRVRGLRGAACTRASRASARACTRSRRTTCSTTARTSSDAAWVPRLVRGELVGAIAMTEPGAGSDLRGISHLAPSATATTTSSTAPRRSSRTACTPTSSASSCAPIPRPARRATRCSWSRPTASRDSRAASPLHKVGQHAQDTCELHFSDCRVPVDAPASARGRGSTT